MSAKTKLMAALWLIVIVAWAATCGCARPQQAMVEQPPAPEKSESPSAPPPAVEKTLLPPPQLEQVQEAVRRVFKDAVTIDFGRNPCFLVGDFNGDESQDLAVVLKPSEGKIAELNQEFPNWIAREPLKEVLLPKSKVLSQRAAAKRESNPSAGQTVRFEQKDVLLAIIHGYGPNGWQDPEATQTHLMRDVVGSDLRVVRLQDAAKTFKGIKPFPNIYGDLIGETLIGQSGFLHFAGSIYDWYDPKNYLPELGPAHPAMSRMR